MGGVQGEQKNQLDTGKKTSANTFGTRTFLDGNYIDRMSGAVGGTDQFPDAARPET